MVIYVCQTPMINVFLKKRKMFCKVLNRALRSFLTFFLCTTYINICLSYSSIHWCQFTFFSWHYCASILSKVLLFHAFINNGNLLKNRGVECVSIMGWTRLKQHFFRFFRVINTQWSHFCEKSLLKRIQNNS